MDKITIDTLNDINPMNNNVIIRNISDSIEDMNREEKLDSKIIIVRNESNTKREKSVGQVVKTADKLYIGNDSNRTYTEINEILEEKVLYDTYSRITEITIKDQPDEKFYLIRFPDIICVLSED